MGRQDKYGKALVESLGPSCSTWCGWDQRKEDTEGQVTTLPPKKQEWLQEVSGRETEIPTKPACLPHLSCEVLRTRGNNEKGAGSEEAEIYKRVKET